MSQERRPCRLCGVMVDPRDSQVKVRREVDTNENRDKGANAISDPGPVLGYTCMNCSEKRRMHLPIGQGALGV